MSQLDNSVLDTPEARRENARRIGEMLIHQIGASDEQAAKFREQLEENLKSDKYDKPLEVSQGLIDMLRGASDQLAYANRNTVKLWPEEFFANKFVYNHVRAALITKQKKLTMIFRDRKEEYVVADKGDKKVVELIHELTDENQYSDLVYPGFIWQPIIKFLKEKTFQTQSGLRLRVYLNYKRYNIRVNIVSDDRVEFTGFERNELPKAGVILTEEVS